MWKWVEGSEKGNMRTDKRVRVKVEESRLEESKNEPENAQGLLTPAQLTTFYWC